MAEGGEVVKGYEEAIGADWAMGAIGLRDLWGRRGGAEGAEGVEGAEMAEGADWTDVAVKYVLWDG